MRHPASLAAIEMLFCALLLGFGQAHAQTFAGTNLGSIPDGTAYEPLSYGAPRDVRFQVDELSGSVFHVSVDFRVSHTWVGDLKVQLMAPDGRVHLVMERTGATTADDLGFESNLNKGNVIRFGDTGAPANWWTATGIGDQAVPSGNYFSAPAGGEGVVNPPEPTSTDYRMRTADPNGVWILRFEDGYLGDAGEVFEANLTITPYGVSREVLTTEDSGPGSLREALEIAGPGDVLYLPGGTLELSSRLPLLPDGVSIIGPGAFELLIRRNSADPFRLFQTRVAAYNTIRGLSLYDGLEPVGNGGAILNAGILYLEGVHMRSNSARLGGAVYNDFTGHLTMNGCALALNSAEFEGGGLYNNVSGIDRVYNCSFVANSANVIGGAVSSVNFGRSGELEFRNNTVAGNSAPSGPQFSADYQANISRLSSNLFAGEEPTVRAAFNTVILSEGYNLATDAAGGLLNQSTDRLNALPGLKSLDFNGGRVPTVALLPGSDAIGAGRVFGVLLNDARGPGYPRISGNVAAGVAGGDGSDIGAFEVFQEHIFGDRFEN